MTFKQRAKKKQLKNLFSNIHYIFSHLLQLLNLFPFHQQHGKTGSSKHLFLPLNNWICVHDISENYRCTELRQLQSIHFQRTGVHVSIYVTIIHCHALLDIDGVESSEGNPEIVAEQQHDPYFIHVVRQSIADYFSSISYRVESIHKFTDGCAAQYNIDIALGISVMTLVSRISPELFLRLHLLKIIFFKSTTVKYMYHITVFNMFVKVFNYKSQTEHDLQPFLKCMLKARF